MEKYFEFVIHIYDGNGELRYYGTGELMVTENSIEGHVCNDYLLIESIENNSYSFLYYIIDSEILMSTKISNIEIEFPGKYLFLIPGSSEVSEIMLEADYCIIDSDRCKQIQEMIEEVRSNIL